MKQVQNVLETDFESTNVWNFGGNKWVNSKLRHRKVQKSILTRRFGDTYGRPGDWCFIWETP